MIIILFEENKGKYAERTEERNLDSDSLTPVAKLLCSKVAHYSDKKA